jgi:hypothetical protein
VNQRLPRSSINRLANSTCIAPAVVKRGVHSTGGSDPAQGSHDAAIVRHEEAEDSHGSDLGCTRTLVWGDDSLRELGHRRVPMMAAWTGYRAVTFRVAGSRDAKARYGVSHL